jgi:hypothetical protein
MLLRRANANRRLYTRRWRGVKLAADVVTIRVLAMIGRTRNAVCLEMELVASYIKYAFAGCPRLQSEDVR